MSDQTVLDRFTQAAPFAVMTRMLSQSFIGEHLDTVFEENRQLQYEYQAKFSAVALAVADVALQFSENFNQAYKTHKENLNTSLQCFYDKIKGVESAVSEAVVSSSSDKAIALQDESGFVPWEVVPGYRCLCVDGNVLAKTDKRLKPLRDAKGAPLPGKVIARFDLQRQLFDKAYLLLDAHAQESTTCQRIVQDLVEDDLIFADRHYCIVSFFLSIAARKAAFIIRQHGRLKGVLLGKRRPLGQISTGIVYEQTLKLSSAVDAMEVRRITIELDEPTRDGDTQIHILSNLPASIDAFVIAEAYRHRWEEETAFHVLQMTLTCESTLVGHPQAGLFLFCMAMLAFNLRQTIFSALFATHPEEEVEQTSHYHISKEISNKTGGMLIALPESVWNKQIPKSIAALAQRIQQIADGIDLSKYKTSKRGPKKKKPQRSRNVASAHISTAKKLNLPL